MRVLKALMLATDEAIGMAIGARHTFRPSGEMRNGTSTNWGHLVCLDAQHIDHADGTESYAVIIEEASPDNPEFQRFIQDELAIRGFKDIEVITEW